MGLLEARETAAQARVEELREEAERVPAELAKAEAVLERRAMARVELAEALAGPEPEAEHPPESAPADAEALVAGSVMPHWRVGLAMKVLAPDYQRLVGVLEAEAGGCGLRARELAGRPGLESVPAKVEGVRSKVKRLMERGWLAEKRPVFTPRRAAG
ncbi:hypothetical protein [Streptomyces collinus]|uniref:hypothetical protein n=1 Tax=Streptomyces collinus TaxID=42684 RepID=UPI002941C5AA|nr:hypothetical protein [Streptomyces collinus]